MTVLLMMFSFTLQAAEITSGTFDDGSPWIQITGDIDTLDDMKFKRKVLELEDQTDFLVFLSSAGGDMDVAYEIGRTIKKYKSIDCIRK